MNMSDIVNSINVKSVVSAYWYLVNKISVSPEVTALVAAPLASTRSRPVAARRPDGLVAFIKELPAETRAPLIRQMSDEILAFSSLCAPAANISPEIPDTDTSLRRWMEIASALCKFEGSDLYGKDIERSMHDTEARIMKSRPSYIRAAVQWDQEVKMICGQLERARSLSSHRIFTAHTPRLDSLK